MVLKVKILTWHDQFHGEKCGSYLHMVGPCGFGALHPIVLAHNKSADDPRGVYAVLSPSRNHGELIVVHPSAEPKENETSRLVDSLWSESLEDSADPYLQSMHFVIHVVLDNKDALSEVNRAVTRAK